MFATPCKFGYGIWSVARNLCQRERITVGPRVFDETVDVGIFLREFRFGALMLVVMTMTAPAALL